MYNTDHWMQSRGVRNSSWRNPRASRVASPHEKCEFRFSFFFFFCTPRPFSRCVSSHSFQSWISRCLRTARTCQLGRTSFQPFTHTWRQSVPRNGRVGVSLQFDLAVRFVATFAVKAIPAKLFRSCTTIASDKSRSERIIFVWLIRCCIFRTMFFLFLAPEKRITVKNLYHLDAFLLSLVKN